MADIFKRIKLSVKHIFGRRAEGSAPSGRRFLLEMLPKESIGMEIGVHEGKFSQQILEVVAPKTLYLVDPWEHQNEEIYEKAWYGGAADGGQSELDGRYEAILKRFSEQIGSGQIKVRREYSDSALDAFEDSSLDWVYIDGNHLYEFVKADLELSLSKVKVGGFITGDDYIEGGWWQGGVKKAVDEFKNNPNVELIELRNRQFIFRRSV